MGGFVVVPQQFRDLFRFTSYTYIFCGQLPPPYLATALTGLEILETEGEQILGRLNNMITYVKTELEGMGYEVVGQNGQLFPLVLVKVGDVYSAPKVSQFFFDEGIHILTTGFPIVPLSRGAMVRISLSPAHSDAQVERLLEVFKKLRTVLPDTNGEG